MKFRLPVILLVSCLSEAPLRAAWQDETGFTRLQTLAGGELPTATPLGLTLVEALLPDTVKYVPDINAPAFAGKVFALKSGPSGVSWHAERTATNFFGSTSQLPGACEVDLYSANDWYQTGFLNHQSALLPAVEARAVQSHSWIGGGGVEDFNRRLDFAIDRDGFVSVVGENNEVSTVLPGWLGQSYHTISVGRDDGKHSAGFTTEDGSGRIKPDIVGPSAAPENATSWTTPMVAGTAGLLHAKLGAAPYSLSGADLPRVIKALLLATATKNTVPSWANTSSRPLDLRYGAGELNAWHAYATLRAGRVDAAPDLQLPPAAWAAQSVDANSTMTYFLTIPPGAPSTPFCATLTWHREIQSELAGPEEEPILEWTATLADLNLRLHHSVDFTPGSLIAESLSTVDNVELVHQAVLAPGQYALVVENTSGSATEFALAWHSLPAVSIVTSAPVAREIDGQAAAITLARSGDTTLPLLVPLTIGGSAIPGSHYAALPASVTIPAGQDSLEIHITPVSDFLAQGDRSVSVAVAADFALVRDPAQIAMVTIEDKPFDSWRFVHFTSLELSDPLISGETADPDFDQLANLIEYALGLPPKSPDASPITPTESGGRLAISVAKNPAATDITWLARVSDHLDAWVPAEILTDTPTLFEARDILPIAGNEKRFIRLGISRP